MKQGPLIVAVAVVAIGILVGVPAFAAWKRRKMFSQVQYKPYSAEAYALFTAAAAKAGVPVAWATDPDLHWIMGKESNGWVGKPNYTFGSQILGHPEHWPAVWERLRKGEVWTKSTATGLGQLLSSNAKALYPDGLHGIGDAFNEAVGFLRYIHKRYGSPAVARGIYGQTGDYVNARTGQTQHKGFTEGY